MQVHGIIFHLLVCQLAFVEHLLFAEPRTRPGRGRKAKRERQKSKAALRRVLAGGKAGMQRDSV